MFSKDDIIFSYTAKQAVADGVLVKADSEQSSRAAIKFPVYFTDAVWNRYVVIPKEFKGIQNLNGRLGDILFMFAFEAKSAQVQYSIFSLPARFPKPANGWVTKRNQAFRFSTAK